LRMDGLWTEVEVLGLEGLEILAWDPGTNCSTFLPLAAVTLRPYAGEVVEVRTKMGRRLRPTVDHPFVVGDGTSSQTEVKLAGDLYAQDWLPMAAAAPVEASTPARRVRAAANVLAAVTPDLIPPPEVIHRLSPAGHAAVQQRADRLPTPRRYDVLRNR